MLALNASKQRRVGMTSGFEGHFFLSFPLPPSPRPQITSSTRIAPEKAPESWGSGRVVGLQGAIYEEKELKFWARGS
uniref:Uncharacterized protein n=1 Tax=Arundo donax TaxID=35708 RepID=A0A0A9CEJ1_ARUDO